MLPKLFTGSLLGVLLATPLTTVFLSRCVCVWGGSTLPHFHTFHTCGEDIRHFPHLLPVRIFRTSCRTHVATREQLLRQFLALLATILLGA